jgi:hypothetical protein
LGCYDGVLDEKKDANEKFDRKFCNDRSLRVVHLCAGRLITGEGSLGYLIFLLGAISFGLKVRSLFLQDIEHGMDVWRCRVVTMACRGECDGWLAIELILVMWAVYTVHRFQTGLS